MNEFIKDEKFWDWVEKTDPNCELTEKELEEIYKATFSGELDNE